MDQNIPLQARSLLALYDFTYVDLVILCMCYADINGYLKLLANLNQNTYVTM